MVFGCVDGKNELILCYWKKIHVAKIEDNVKKFSIFTKNSEEIQLSQSKDSWRNKIGMFLKYLNIKRMNGIYLFEDKN